MTGVLNKALLMGVQFWLNRREMFLCSGHPHRVSPIRLSVSLSVLYPDMKTKRYSKAKIGSNISLIMSKRCVNFQFRRSEIKLSGCQKPPENDAHLA